MPRQTSRNPATARRLAAESAQERVAAKAVLAELLLRDLRENPAVPYEQDEVTRIIQDDLNERIYAEMQNWTRLGPARVDFERDHDDGRPPPRLARPHERDGRRRLQAHERS